MSKKTKVFTPENMQIIADLRAKKVPSVKIATILGVSPSALARAVAKHDLPKKRKTEAQPFVVAQYVHQTGAAPISLEEMAAKPKAQTITERRAVAYVPPEDVEAARREVSGRWYVAKGGLDRSVSFDAVEKLSRGELPKAEEPIRVYEAPIDALIGKPLADNPFRLKGRVCEFDRDRTALLEEVEGEIDKVFRKFRTLAGPNTRIDNPVVFGRLSTEAHAAYNHLQALMSAARRLRLIKVELAKAALDLHLAGAAATRTTA